jgi:hypothetical protein
VVPPDVLKRRCKRGNMPPVQPLSDEAHPPPVRSNSPSPTAIHDPLPTLRVMAIKSPSLWRIGPLPLPTPKAHRRCCIP